MASPYIYLTPENKTAYNSKDINKNHVVYAIGWPNSGNIPFENSTLKAYGFYMNQFKKNFLNGQLTNKDFEDIKSMLEKDFVPQVDLEVQKFKEQLSTKDLNDLDQILKKVEAYVTAMDRSIEDGSFNMDAILSDLANPGNKKSFTALLDKYHKISDGLYDIPFAQRNKTQKSISRYIATAQALKKAVEIGQTDGAKGAFLVDKIKNSLSGYLSSYVGSYSETVLPDIINKKISESLDTYLIATGTGAFYSRDKELDKKTTNKTDTALNYVKTYTSSDGEKHTISLQLPGISQKVIGGLDAKTRNISIESGRPLGSVLQKISLFTNKSEERIFLNLLGKAYYKGGSERSPWFNNAQEAWHNLIDVYLIFALGGKLTSSDLVYFFVVNDKVFTVPEILKQAFFGGKDKKFSAAGDFPKGAIQAAARLNKKNKNISAEERSERVYSALTKIKVNTKLKTATELLRRKV